jgi:UDP-glucose 4-epimerase
MSMTTHSLVTGGAGFIGSTLADRLLEEGQAVTVIDNFSTGFAEFLARAEKNPRFKLVRGDILDTALLAKAMQGIDTVFHLSANADVRFGLENPRRDLEQNTIGTFNVLEAMRANGVRKICFSSTGSIYGEARTIPTGEDAPFPVQTSLYGASKLAGEGLIQSYCEGFGFQSWIFRFVSVLGERYTHGHIFDFFRELNRDATRLKVLGDGRQRKSYMYVQDCIDAIFLAMGAASERVNIFNLGVDGYCEINDSIKLISKALGVSPRLEYSGGERGWIGDNPFIHLDIRKIVALGWHPKVTIEDGILRTLRWLEGNQWVYRRRS